MNEESRALANALELASDLENDNFRGNTTQVVNTIRALTEETELMIEWMKTNPTGDSDYPTSWDCFSADHHDVDIQPSRDKENALVASQQCCTQRGARMQKMYKWIDSLNESLHFHRLDDEAMDGSDYREMYNWFDEDGVPK